MLHNNLTNDFKNKIIYNIEFTKKKIKLSKKQKNNCFYKYLKDINPELKKISFVKFNDYFNKLDSDLKDKLFDNFHSNQTNKNHLFYFQQSFVSLEIQKYIEQECFYNYFIKNNFASMNLYNSSDYIKKKLIQRLFHKILIIQSNYIKLDNPNIYLSFTPYKKILPKKKFTPKNINSGYCWGNNIVIFRKEEVSKVLLHELIHYYKIEGNINNSQKIQNFIKNTFLTKDIINNKTIFVAEAFVETIANFWNIVSLWVEINNNLKYSIHDFLIYFILKENFVYFSVLKLLNI